MPEVVLDLILGLGTGAAYALLANGIVTTYKGSGILNFAQAGIAMFATYCYVALLNLGMSKYVALPIVMLGAALGGALISVVIMRPLRNAPVLAKVVATLGLLLALEGLAALIWTGTGEYGPSLLPTTSVSLTGGGHVGLDRLLMFAASIVVAVLLWAVYRFTRFGLATQASSENERGIALLGFSPTVVAATNWALGAALAALAGALILPLTGVTPTDFPLIVFPAMAAALVGGFSSFGITTAAAIIIGCVENLLFSVWAQPGIETATPFVIVMLVMVFFGRALPARGTLATGPPPAAASGRIRPVTFCIAVGGAVLLLVFCNKAYQGALTTSFVTATIALSLVVVTGYVGQVSLMQMAFAGFGGLITAKLAANFGVPFPLSIVAAAVITAPIGALLGLPAVRVRGMSLAVVTLGAAIAVDAIVFENPSWTGQTNGLSVPLPEFAGLSLDPNTHPVRFGLFALLVLVVVAVAVSNLRRSGTGRRMLAVRDNERAAAVAGVSVTAIKLQAFTVSAVIAALGGGLLAYSNPYFIVGSGLQAGAFSAVTSISLLTVAYIGGIASVSGAVVAGMIGAGGVFYLLISGFGPIQNDYVLISGIGLIWTVIAHPAGIAVFQQELLRKLEWRFARRAHRRLPEPAVHGTEVAES